MGKGNAMTKHIAMMLFAGSLLVPSSAQSQDSPAPAPTETTAAAPDLAAPASEPTSSDEIKKQLKALQDENAKLAERLTEVEDTQAQSSPLSQVQSMFGRTRVFGYFDMLFTKIGWDGDNSIYNSFYNNNSSFMMSGINLYVANQMTERLGMLAEFRYSFQPLGHESSKESYVVMPDGSTMDLKSSYSRVDTTVQDPFTLMRYRQGGVTLERVHLTYTLADYFKIIAGHFLTPYGIWNVDHGSPVILMVRAPYMQQRETVPLTQTGVQLFGRVFPVPTLSVDYAVTVSNGRGPVDSTMDYDNNKALGLRLRLNLELDSISIALGEYAYYGKYTDIKKGMYMGPGTTDIHIKVTPTSVYDEYISATDLLIKIRGLRLQSEFVRRLVKYSVSPSMTPSEAATLGISAMAASKHHYPSFVGTSIYGLAAYEIPLDDLVHTSVRVTPYLYYERYLLNDQQPWEKSSILAGGLNIRPSAFLVLKLEYSQFMPLVSVAGTAVDGSTVENKASDIRSYTAQMAVTF